MSIILEKLKDYFAIKNRDKNFLAFVETERWWISLIILCFYVVIIFSSLALIYSFAPAEYLYTQQPMNSTFNYNAYFNGLTPMTGSIGNLGLSNQVITFYAIFNNVLPQPNGNDSTQYFGFDTMLNFQLLVTGNSAGDVIFFGNITSVLTCPQNLQCMPVYLLQIQPITRGSYTTTVSCFNAQFLYQSQLVTTQVGLQYAFINVSYTNATTILSILFLVISGAFTIIYLITLIHRQYFLKWSLEQRFTVILLFFTFFYNNPIFWIDYIISSWISGFVATIFIVTYYCYLLLSILVFTHSIITVKEHRSYLYFYAPKCIIVLVLWLFLIVCLTYYSVSAQTGASAWNYSNLQSYTPEYIAFAVLLAILFLVYFFALVYYFVKVASKLRVIPRKNIKKFLFIWGFTIVIIVLSVTDLTLFFTGVTISGASFNAFLIGYNVYSYAMGIMFWPSRGISTVEEDTAEKQSIESHEANEFAFK